MNNNNKKNKNNVGDGSEALRPVEQDAAAAAAAAHEEDAANKDKDDPQHPECVAAQAEEAATATATASVVEPQEFDRQTAAAAVAFAAEAAEEEIRKCFQQWYDAWNAGNLSGYLNAYYNENENTNANANKEQQHQQQEQPTTTMSVRYTCSSLAKVPGLAGNVSVTGYDRIAAIITNAFDKMQKQCQQRHYQMTLTHLQVAVVSPTDAICYGEYKMHTATTSTTTTQQHDNDPHPQQNDQEQQQQELLGQDSFLPSGVFTIHVHKFCNDKKNSQWKILSEHSTEVPVRQTTFSRLM